MTGLILIAIGAILYFAVHVHSSVVSIQTVGGILMLVGLVEFLVELFFFRFVRKAFRNDNFPF